MKTWLFIVSMAVSCISIMEGTEQGNVLGVFGFVCVIILITSMYLYSKPNKKAQKPLKEDVFRAICKQLEDAGYTVIVSEKQDEK